MRRFVRLTGCAVLAVLTPVVLPGPVPSASADAARAALDPTYGDGGVATLRGPDPEEVGAEFPYAVAAGFDPLGRAVVLTSGTRDLWRLTADGQPDLTFGDRGSVALPELVPARVEASLEHLVIVGAQVDGDPVVLRLRADGSADPTFGDGGFATVARGPHTQDRAAAALAEDGSVALLVSGDDAVAVHRFGADGRPDPAFGEGGVVTFPAPADLDVDAADVAIDGAGRLLVVEYREDEGAPGSRSFSSRVLRLEPDGDLDPTFGTAGASTFEGFGGHVVAIDSADGSIHVGGVSRVDDTEGLNAAAVLRLTPDGRGDLRFGPAGHARAVPEGVRSALVWGVAALPGGRTAVMADTASSEAVVSVLRADGSLEPSLGEDGLLRTGQRWAVDGVGVGADGRLLAATSWATEVDQDGESQVSAYLLDLPPSAPAVTAVDVHDAALSVEWVPAEVPLAATPVRAHQVFALDGAGRVVSARTVPGDVRQVSLPGVPVDDEAGPYDVIVVPYDELGALPASARFAVDPAGPALAVDAAGPVTQLEATAGSSFALVRWKPPAFDGGVPIDGYSVIAVRADTGAFVTWRNVAPDVRWMTLPGLADPAQVRIYVTAITSKGFGALAPPVAPESGSGNVASGRPNLPWAAIVPLGPQALVTWGAPLEHGEVAFEHHVISIVDGDELADWVVTSEVGRHAVVDAPPGAVIYVMARSASGFGPPQVFEVA